MKNSADLLILEKVNQFKKLAKCHVLCNMHEVLPVVAQKTSSHLSLHVCSSTGNQRCKTTAWLVQFHRNWQQSLTSKWCKFCCSLLLVQCRKPWSMPFGLVIQEHWNSCPKTDLCAAMEETRWLLIHLTFCCW